MTDDYASNHRLLLVAAEMRIIVDDGQLRHARPRMHAHRYSFLMPAAFPARLPQPRFEPVGDGVGTDLPVVHLAMLGATAVRGEDLERLVL